MKTNLLKILLRGKSIFTLFTIPVLSVSAAAQSAAVQSAPETALSGSTSARISSPWFVCSNPAALLGPQSLSLSVSFSPSVFGIPGYFEGNTLVTVPTDSTIRLAVLVRAANLNGYHELTGTMFGSVSLSEQVAIGVSLAYNNLSIDGYGSASAPAIDIGGIAELSRDVRFGLALSNVVQGSINGEPFPRRVRTGLSFQFDNLEVSVDALQESNRSASASLGFSYVPLQGLMILIGTRSNPAGFSLGAEFISGAVRIEYGAEYLNPTGIRQVFGAGYRW